MSENIVQTVELKYNGEPFNWGGVSNLPSGDYNLVISDTGGIQKVNHPRNLTSKIMNIIKSNKNKSNYTISILPEVKL